MARYTTESEHLKPRNNNKSRAVNEHFEPPIQQLTPMLSTPTNILAKPSTPIRPVTPVCQPKAATPVKATGLVKSSQETVSFKPRSLTIRSRRTSQVPAKFKDKTLVCYFPTTVLHSIN